MPVPEPVAWRVAKILPPTRKSGWPICAFSSAPGKESAIRRKSSVLAIPQDYHGGGCAAKCLNPPRDRKARLPRPFQRGESDLFAARGRRARSRGRRRRDQGG